MEAALLRALFLPYAAESDGSMPEIRKTNLTKVDFYLDGLYHLINYIVEF